MSNYFTLAQARALKDAGFVKAPEFGDVYYLLNEVPTRRYVITDLSGDLIRIHGKCDKSDWIDDKELIAYFIYTPSLGDMEAVDYYNNYVLGSIISTHWVDCWKVHLPCAIKRIKRLETVNE